MKRFLPAFLSTLLLLSLFTNVVALAPAEDKKDDKKEEPVEIVLKHDVYEDTTPIALLKAPEQFLDKGVRFLATFNSFSNLGLDYEKAMRESKDYISMLILRPDVKHHKIPLSELKLIYPRKQSEAVLNLESGDKIRLTGSVFSQALGDPWVDVEQVEVIEKVEKKEEK